MRLRLHLCWFVIPAALFFWSCTSSTNPVKLYGEKVDLNLLEGEWKGDYFSKDTGRSGIIEFTLTAEKDKAIGDVIMIPRGSEEPYRQSILREKADADTQFPKFLTIQFVEVFGGKIRGELTPYWDPEMQRRLFTTFEGELKGDSIEGTFESQIEQSPIYFYGQWRVFRKKK
jgi:hypothetical protein